MANCDSEILIVNTNGNAIIGGNQAYNAYSNFGVPQTTHGMFKYEDWPNSLPSPNPVQFCQGSQNNVVQKLYGLYVSDGGGGSVGSILPGMPQVFYGPTSSWWAVRLDLVNAGYANLGDDFFTVQSNPAFQAAGGHFNISNQTCICTLCCTESDFIKKSGFLLNPVLSTHPSYPANLSTYTTFGQNMWSHFNGTGSLSGCAWWVNRVAVWTSQLPNITNPYQLALKQAKIQFA